MFCWVIFEFHPKEMFCCLLCLLKHVMQKCTSASGIYSQMYLANTLLPILSIHNHKIEKVKQRFGNKGFKNVELSVSHKACKCTEDKAHTKTSFNRQSVVFVFSRSFCTCLKMSPNTVYWHFLCHKTEVYKLSSFMHLQITCARNETEKKRLSIVQKQNGYLQAKKMY